MKYTMKGIMKVARDIIILLRIIIAGRRTGIVRLVAMIQVVVIQFQQHQRLMIIHLLLLLMVEIILLIQIV